jgi:hypothetical protein
MLYDPEFHKEQAYYGLPRGLNHEFDRFLLYNGGIDDDDPLLIGELEPCIVERLDWPTGKIYATSDFAQKVRFKHEISFSLFHATMVVQHGNIFEEKHRGNGMTVVFTLPLAPEQPRWFYLPCKLDRVGRGIFAKTMRFGSIRRNQWARMNLLHSRVRI